MGERPRRNRQEFGAVSGHREGKPLPESLRNERHDWMQQSQCVVEHVREYRARDLAVAAQRTDAALGGLEVPVRDVVPDETARGFSEFAEAKPRITLVRPPLSFLWPRLAERRIALENRGVEPSEYPPVGKRELVVGELVHASHRGSADVDEQESSDVPQLRREIAAGRERALEVLMVEHQIRAHAPVSYT